MTYIVHMMGGRDIEMSDEEHKNLIRAKEKGDDVVVRSNEELLNLKMMSSSERVVETPKNDPKAVDNFMEKQREKEKDNPPTKPYGSRTNAS